MDKPLQLTFDNGYQAIVGYINRSTDLTAFLDLLQIPLSCSTLVVVGGASGLTGDYLDQLRVLFEDVLCPTMQDLQGAVIDGGTDTGVMRLMGQAHSQTRSQFPLIGIAAEGTVCLPQADPPPSEDYAMLEPHHSHFLLVPGMLWGDEVPWIAKIAGIVAGQKPSLTILINGGKIAWQDVENSVRSGRPVLVIKGSGRTADELAAAIEGDRSSDRANYLVASGLLSCIALTDSPEVLQQGVFKFLR
jgi:hypothetical protein